jgi:hypothetical protein
MTNRNNKKDCKKDFNITLGCIVVVFVIVAIVFNIIQWVSKIFK